MARALHFVQRVIVEEPGEPFSAIGFAGQFDHEPAVQQRAVHVEQREPVCAPQQVERVLGIGPAEPVPLPGITQRADAQATPFGGALEDGSRHLRRHLAQRREALAVVFQRADVHFRDPRPLAERVNQQADVHTVVILEPEPLQHGPACRNDSAQRLAELGQFREICP